VAAFHVLMNRDEREFQSANRMAASLDKWRKKPSIRLNAVDKLNGVQYIDVSWALRNEESGMRARCGSAY
jgi:hypothetical protein